MKVFTTFAASDNLYFEINKGLEKFLPEVFFENLECCRMTLRFCKFWLKETRHSTKRFCIMSNEKAFLLPAEFYRLKFLLYVNLNTVSIKHANLTVSI